MKIAQSLSTTLDRQAMSTTSQLALWRKRPDRSLALICVEAWRDVIFMGALP